MITPNLNSRVVKNKTPNALDSYTLKYNICNKNTPLFFRVVIKIISGVPKITTV